jgi:hypothetical protein
VDGGRPRLLAESVGDWLLNGGSCRRSAAVRVVVGSGEDAAERPLEARECW